jgi:hypothetical protein
MITKQEKPKTITPCTECGDPVESLPGRVVKRMCRGTRTTGSVTGRQIYKRSDCELAYIARWRKDNPEKVKRSSLNVPAKKKKVKQKRTCLRGIVCDGGEFDSIGPYNRTCPRCKTALKYVHDRYL